MRINRTNITAIGDCCPECDLPTGPAAATEDGVTVSSIYKCINGHEWTTNRNIAAYEDFLYAVDYMS